jgi:hypothetical protein
MFTFLGDMIAALSQSISDPLAFWIAKRFGKELTPVRTPVRRFILQCAVFGLVAVPLFILMVVVLLNAFLWLL